MSKLIRAEAGLREALERYGTHESDCNYWHVQDGAKCECSCGLDAALAHCRRGIGIELKPDYFDMACNRLRHGTVDPEEVAQAERQGILFGEGA